MSHIMFFRLDGVEVKMELRSVVGAIASELDVGAGLRIEVSEVVRHRV